MKEIELKYLLSNKDELNAIETYFSNSNKQSFQTLKQINHFFDTQNKLLRKKNITLRLRQQNNDYLLTIKGPNQKRLMAATLFIRIEKEISISKKQAQDFLALKSSPLLFLAKINHDDNNLIKLLDQALKIVKKEELCYIGNFSNKRLKQIISVDGNNISLELDETTFPQNIIRYEAELELEETLDPHAVDIFFKNVLNQLKIKSNKSSGKSDQFFQIVA